MIKVEHTKTHSTYEVTIPRKQFTEPVLVTDPKLMLVECKPEEALFIHRNTTGVDIINHYSYNQQGLVKGIFYKYLKPILISETEKIEVGEQFSMGAFTNWKIEVRKDVDYGVFEPKYKILALSEHFSPEQLQMIVDGKLKDGDKVLVECERGGNFDPYDNQIPGMDYWYQIKLNPHITIYPVEEKMYTRDEVNERIRQAYVDGYENGYQKGNWHGEIEKRMV